MAIKTLDPYIAMKLIEGELDLVTPAQEARDKFYAAQSCPRCGGSCKKHGNFQTMFSGDDFIPKFLLECCACGEVFDPDTGIIVKLGNIGNAGKPAIPIINAKPR